uniref:LOW QUALITY PROTEIN: aladin-like n=1 Tax=Crassostrea virginica TaxID=6565 RepID=A0A8B8BYQ4_CRAVI|nr:LOW QUALITY PROTEIN: aladin-like [Crassostrea virginica]
MSNEESITDFSQIALGDDSIKVHFSAHSQTQATEECAWQPQSASVLAVACQSCVLIWHVEPTSLATRPSTSSCQVLQQNHHAPVTCLAWDPSGRILLSASPVDTSLMAWDVPCMETCIPLRRLGGGGVSLLRWSPDGSKVLSATPSQLFRVWETRTWTCEVWTKCTSRCKMIKVRCCPIYVLCHDSVSFSGLVQGETGEYPLHVSFQPSFDRGALLSVVWSSGVLRYVPLYFIPSDKIQNAQYHQPAPPTLNGNILSPIARHR